MAIRVSQNEKVLGVFPASGFRAVCEVDDGGKQKTLPVLAVVVLHDTERNTIRVDVLTDIGLHVRSDLPESVALDKRSNSDQLSTHLPSQIDTTASATTQRTKRVLGTPPVPPNLYARFYGYDGGLPTEDRVISLVVVEQIDEEGKSKIYLDGFVSEGDGMLVSNIEDFDCFVMWPEKYLGNPCPSSPLSDGGAQKDGGPDESVF